MIALLPAPALAIVNAEDLDLSIDHDGAAGKIEGSLSGSSGNSNTLRGEAGGRLIWRHGAHLEMLVGSAAYGKSRGVRNSNKSFAHLRHRYRWNDHWALEGFAQVQQDEFAHLKLRTLFGGGLRWSGRQQAWSWHVGLGSFYEREALRGSASVTRLWRASSYLALAYAPSKQLRLQNTLYYQPAWKDRADYRLLDDAALLVGLAEHLDLKLTLELAQDSRPPAGIARTDIAYKTGLSYRF